jgi:hypothetical protein
VVASTNAHEQKSVIAKPLDDLIARHRVYNTHQDFAAQ